MSYGVEPRTYEVESLSHFVSLVAETLPQKDTVLFRGQQREKDWPLLPKLARLRLRLRDTALSAEQKLLEDFRLQAVAFPLDLEPNNDWEWLSLAQHYGMPTRLLDWTTNSLAALWFAVRAPAMSEAGATLPGVVWVLDPKRSDQVRKRETTSPFRGTHTRVFRPNQIARKICAQSGWFTVHKFAARANRFVPLERQARYKEALTKINVPAHLFSDLRFDLDRCGVNAASMLADLAGLCQHIEWYHSFLADERH